MPTFPDGSKQNSEYRVYSSSMVTYLEIMIMIMSDLGYLEAAILES